MNVYEERARERKVGLIAAFVLAHAGAQVNLEMLGGLEQPERTAIARAAGARPPSQTTWERVVELVQRVPGRPRTADPFARFDAEAA